MKPSPSKTPTVVRPPTPASPPVQLAAAPLVEELPTVTTLGIVRRPRGRVVVVVTSRGDRILDTEALTEVVPRDQAITAFKRALVKYLIDMDKA